MTDLEPTPDRVRFPWAQLAFSAACLGMAAWLWWTYSRCVSVRPADLCAPDAWKLLAGRYVELTGQPTYLRRDRGDVVFLGIIDPDVVLDPDCQGTDGLPLAAWVFARRAPDAASWPPRSGTVLMSGGPWDLILPSPSHATETYRGRVVLMPSVIRPPRTPFWVAVDARVGRFGGEFFAGAAVAAMGLFIFALYLRGWRAAAGRAGEATPRARVA